MINSNIKSVFVNQHESIDQDSTSSECTNFFIGDQIDFYKILESTTQNENVMRINGLQAKNQDKSKFVEYEVQLKPPYLYSRHSDNAKFTEIIVPSYVLIEHYDVSKRLQDFLIFEGADSFQDIMEMYKEQMCETEEFWSYDIRKNVFKIKIADFIGTNETDSDQDDSWTESEEEDS